MKRLFLFLMVWCIPYLMYSQYAEHIWYFGGSIDGLSITTGLQFSQIDSSLSNFNNIRFPLNLQENNIMLTDDQTGDIRFYSDGQQIIDASHSPMPNGRDLFGTPSTMYGTAIVYDPNGCNRYIIFYGEDENASPPRQVYYSIVDLDLPGNGTLNEPLGDIVSGQKNIPVLNTNINAAEGVYALPKSDSSKESWLFVGNRDQNQLLIFDVSPAGVDLHVTYNLQDLFANNNWTGTIFGLRLLYFSDTETSGRLVVAPARGELDQILPMGYLNFDRSTGQLLDDQVTLIADDTEWTYGLEFSPDGSKLYVSDYFKKQVSQYDFNTSMYTLITTSGHFGRSGGLKLGPDGQIYWASRFVNFDRSLVSSLSVIRNPNAAGLACDLQYDVFAINGNPNPSFLGAFPRFGSLPPPPQVEVLNADLSCSGSIGSARITSSPGQTPFSYLWDNGETTQTAINLSAGLHLVTISDAIGCTSTASVTIPSSNSGISDTPVIAEGFDPISCLAPFSGSIRFENPMIFKDSTYIITYSLERDPTSAYSVTKVAEIDGVVILDSLSEDNYIDLILLDYFGCPYIIPNNEIELFLSGFIQVPEINSDGINCQGGDLVLSTNLDTTLSYEWNTPQGQSFSGSVLSLSDLSSEQSGSYSLRVSNDQGCESDLAIFDLMVETPPEDLIPDTSLCANSYVVQLPADLTGISWDDGSSTNSRILNQSGNYSFNAKTITGCSVNDFFSLELTTVPEVSLPDTFQVVECIATPFPALNLDDLAYSVRWEADNGIRLSCNDCANPSIDAEQSGRLDLILSENDGACKVEASTYLTVRSNYQIYIPNAFSPNSDGVNDGFTVFSKNANTVIEQMEIFTRWGDRVFYKLDIPVNDANSGWNGRSLEGDLFDSTVYIYRIVVRFSDGNREEFSGNIHLMN